MPSEFIIAKISSVKFSPRGRSSVSCILTTGNSPHSMLTFTSPGTVEDVLASSRYCRSGCGGSISLDSGGVAVWAGDESIFTGSISTGIGGGGGSFLCRLRLLCVETGGGGGGRGSAPV